METSAITDRDLLELVAKVAGVEVLWKHGEWQLVGATGVTGTRSPTMVMRCGWRATKAHDGVDPVWRIRRAVFVASRMYVYSRELLGNDPAAAARRAMGCC